VAFVFGVEAGGLFVAVRGRKATFHAADPGDRAKSRGFFAALWPVELDALAVAQHQGPAPATKITTADGLESVARYPTSSGRDVDPGLLHPVRYVEIPFEAVRLLPSVSSSAASFPARFHRSEARRARA